MNHARKHALGVGLLSLLLPIGLIAAAPTASATDNPPTCVDQPAIPGTDAYDETIVDAEAYEETVIDVAAQPAQPAVYVTTYYYRQHATGNERSSTDPDWNPGQGWTLFKQDVTEVSPATPAIPEQSHTVQHEAVTHTVHHAAVPGTDAIVCSPVDDDCPPAEPPVDVEPPVVVVPPVVEPPVVIPPKVTPPKVDTPKVDTPVAETPTTPPSATTLPDTGAAPLMGLGAIGLLLLFGGSAILLYRKRLN